MPQRDRTIQLAMLGAGTLITLAVIAAWLWGKTNGIETTELMAFAVPVVGALFLVTPLTKAADSAAQAAQQTNGAMDARIKSAVSAALADRDAARTRQAVGDVGTTEQQ
ncbi:hypothetical protein ACWEOW_11270 [Monashia sp. NPDC004114]